MTLRYHGNGPYCVANSLTMIFDDAGPGPAAIEVLSGTPYGLAIYGDDHAYWCPQGWDPETGLMAALDLLGWTCDRTAGDADQAFALLRQTTPDRPALVGPIEMGLLPYVPGLGHAVGADHYMLVMGVEGDTVRAHDAQGWPFVTLSVDQLRAAWNTETLPFEVESYALRTNFRQFDPVDAHTAMRRSLPTAERWLANGRSAEVAERLASMIESGLTNMQYKYLVEFTVHGGSRRLSDAAVLLAEIGCDAAARIVEQQAMLTGSLQTQLVTQDNAAAAATVRKLGPTYEQLRIELRAAIG